MGYYMCLSVPLVTLHNILWLSFGHLLDIVLDSRCYLLIYMELSVVPIVSL